MFLFFILTFFRFKNLILASFLVTLVAGGSVHAAAFKDVPLDHPHYAAIESLKKDMVIQGTSLDTFSPDDAVSRAAALKMILVGLEAYNADQDPSGFDILEPVGINFKDDSVCILPNTIVGNVIIETNQIKSILPVHEIKFQLNSTKSVMSVELFVDNFCSSGIGATILTQDQLVPWCDLQVFVLVMFSLENFVVYDLISFS